MAFDQSINHPNYFKKAEKKVVSVPKPAVIVPETVSKPIEEAVEMPKPKKFRLFGKKKHRV